jgi:hypothetical protein
MVNEFICDAVWCGIVKIQVNMKSIIKAIIIVGLILRNSSGSYAQISEYRYASLKVITPVTTIKNKAQNTYSTTFLALANTASHTMGTSGKAKESIIANNNVTEQVSTANFSVVGQPSIVYAITLPSSYHIGLSSGIITGRIFINSLSSVYILGLDGTQTLGVGATLSTAHALPGKYFDSLLIPVTVNYY